jgi:hypothetical protein
LSVNALAQVWFQNRRAKFRRNERNLLTQRHHVAAAAAVLYQPETPPLAMDPTAAAALQARMNPALYRSSADYWSSPTGAYSTYASGGGSAFDGGYCVRQSHANVVAGAASSASLSSCALSGGALYGQQPPLTSSAAAAAAAAAVGVHRYHDGMSGAGLLRAGGYQPDSW